jgi:hypothetical protein
MPPKMGAWYNACVLYQLAAPGMKWNWRLRGQFHFSSTSVPTQSLRSQICAYKHIFFTYRETSRAEKYFKMLVGTTMTCDKENLSKCRYEQQCHRYGSPGLGHQTKNTTFRELVLLSFSDKKVGHDLPLE